MGSQGAKTSLFGQRVVAICRREFLLENIKCQWCLFKRKTFYKRAGSFFLMLFHPTRHHVLQRSVWFQVSGSEGRASLLCGASDHISSFPHSKKKI